MARSVKDLRDLICVSRLTFRDSDEEGSDEDLTRPLSSLSLYGEGCSNTNTSLNSTDSSSSFIPRPPSTSAKGAKPRKKGVFRASNLHSQLPPSFDFRKLRIPLPPVCNTSSRESSRPSTASSSGSSDRPSSEETVHEGYFDHILQHMDSSCVNEWLTRSNIMVSDLTGWCNHGENFVHFAHFWLTEFPEYQRIDLIKMEVGILSDELTIAFADGIRAGYVKPIELNSLVLAVLREYPNRLCSIQGPHVFLNLLDTLSSERTHEYKHLLTDVKISTRNRNYAQWMLTFRAFLLLNVWSNIVKFYRRFKSEVIYQSTEVEDGLKVRQIPDAIKLRPFQAVRLGYVSVLYYLIKSGKVQATVRDDRGRTLVFAAVMYNQQQILHYLVTKLQGLVSVNSPCRESGNTPLHAAASWGYTELVKLLLEKGEANTNVTNPRCDQATPLHLAVMQGHYDVCHTLLQAGADTAATMSGITPIDLAQGMGHAHIHELLIQNSTNDEEADHQQQQHMDDC